jgi:hypothetical protein
MEYLMSQQNDDRNAPIEQYTFNFKDWGDDMVIDGIDNWGAIRGSRRADCSEVYPHSLRYKDNGCFTCMAVTASEKSKSEQRHLERLARMVCLEDYRPGDKPMTIGEWFKSWFGWS